MSDIWNIPRGHYAVSIHIKLADTDDQNKPIKHKHLVLFIQKEAPEEYVTNEVKTRTSRVMELLWKEEKEEENKGE